MPRSDHYDDDGSETSERCPQCGDVFLADHEDRKHCGACGFTEWK